MEKKRLGIEIPPSLQWLRAEPGGTEWLNSLPDLIALCRRQWGLSLGEAFEGNVSYVAPAESASGSQVVLKINFPHEESRTEPVALRHWDGNGAVRLIDELEDARALLLERCFPGRQLWDVEESVATEAIAGVFKRLWERPASDVQFQSLAGAAEVWRDHLAAAYARAGSPFEADLFDEALTFMATTPPPTSDDVVLHQDLHGGNVLSRGDEWVVIDPKPLVGERAFDLTSYIRDRRPELTTNPDAPSIVRSRIDTLSDTLGLDRDRVRGWAIAHALAWGFDASGDFYPEHIVVARLVARC